MSFDHVLVLMEDRTRFQVVLSQPETGLDLEESMIVSDDLLVAQQLLCRTGDVALDAQKLLRPLNISLVDADVFALDRDEPCFGDRAFAGGDVLSAEDLLIEVLLVPVVALPGEVIDGAPLLGRVGAQLLIDAGGPPVLNGVPVSTTGE